MVLGPQNFASDRFITSTCTFKL